MAKKDGKQKDKPAQKPTDKAKRAKAAFFRGATLMADPDQAVAHFPEILHQKKRLFLEAYSQVPRIGRACRAAGIDASTSLYWRRDQADPQFLEAFERAHKMAIENAEGELWRRGVEGIEKPVYQGGRLVGTVREYSDTAAIFMLKGALPEKYRERHEHSGPNGGPIQNQHQVMVANLSNEDLRRELEAVRTALVERPVLDIGPSASPEQVPESPESAYARFLIQQKPGSDGEGHGR